MFKTTWQRKGANETSAVSYMQLGCKDTKFEHSHLKPACTMYIKHFQHVPVTAHNPRGVDMTAHHENKTEREKNTAKLVCQKKRKPPFHPCSRNTRRKKQNRTYVFIEIASTKTIKHTDAGGTCRSHGVRDLQKPGGLGEAERCPRAHAASGGGNRPV